MHRFSQHLLVYTLLVSSVCAKFQQKIALSDGVNFFQGFNGYSCYWNEYQEDLEWNTINHERDPVQCANLCFNHLRCTGFELSYSDHDPYCAFWYGGACGHEEMGRTVPYQFMGRSRESEVATYVLMDGHARFHQKTCDYNALNMTVGDKMTNISNVAEASESTCSDMCDTMKNCTGSVAPTNYGNGCKLLWDHSCTTPDQTSKKQVTTIKYPLPPKPFTDSYSMCNPYSEVLRGYATCAQYADAFPCDCDRKLSDLCSNEDAAASGGKAFLWKRQTSSRCSGPRLDVPVMLGSLNDCKAVCEGRSECGCFDFGMSLSGNTCSLHSSTDVVPGLIFFDAYSVTRISYDPEAQLSTLCPSECQAATDKAALLGHRCSRQDPWYSDSIDFLLILTPIMFVAVIIMAIWTYVRRRCFGAHAPGMAPQIPAMDKAEIDVMETEEFTSESELKYGEIECSICLEAFEVGDIMRVMKCGHRFHKPCVDEWLGRYKSVCPLCKIDMRGDGATEGEESCTEGGEGGEGGGDVDIEMGAMTPEGSESETVHMSESEGADNRDNTRQRAVTGESEASNLNEPLLENESQHTSIVANDSLATPDAAMDMLPLMQEETENGAVELLETENEGVEQKEDDDVEEKENEDAEEEIIAE